MFDISRISISTAISDKSFIEHLPQVMPKLIPSLNSNLDYKMWSNLYEIYSWRASLRARACVCVYILPPWRLLPTARCPRHAWEVRINDLVLWIFIWVLLPSSFISISKSILFHLRRRNSSPPKNCRENDMIYCAPAKGWYI